MGAIDGNRVATDARGGLRHHVETAPVGIRSRGAESGDLTVDKAWIEIVKGLVINTKPLGNAGAGVDDHYVAPSHLLMGNGQTFRALQVQDQTALAAIHLKEPPSIAAVHRQVQSPAVAAGRLDLDDVRAQVGQNHRAVRARNVLGEIGDANAFHNCRHRGLLDTWLRCRAHHTLSHEPALSLNAIASVKKAGWSPIGHRIVNVELRRGLC